MGAFRDMLDDVRTLLSSVDTLVESPAPIEALDLSDTLAAPMRKMGFSVDIQSSDTGEERQATLMRVEHVVRVQMLARLRQHGQAHTTMGEALDAEQSVIAAMLTTRNLPGYRTRWLATTRELVGGGAYYLISHQFSLVGTTATGRT